jgi:four helix bundle protein
MSNSYKALEVWQLAIDLVTKIYAATRQFPREELYGLTGQLRRAAISVPSNIAEGQGRLSPGEFRQFLSNARGSLMEIETQLVIASNLGYLAKEQERELSRICERVNQMLFRLVQAISDAPAPGQARVSGNVKRKT